jgi:hypothetical protein
MLLEAGCGRIWARVTGMTMTTADFATLGKETCCMEAMRVSPRHPREHDSL